MRSERRLGVSAMLVVIPLAFAWHAIGVWSFFPIGGAELHWLFHRPGGATVEGVSVVAVAYLAVGIALSVLLLARTSRTGAWSVSGVIAASFVLSVVSARSAQIAEVLFGTLLSSVSLTLVAVVLWQARRLHPRWLAIFVVAIPGVWSLWGIYSFPSAGSAHRRVVLFLLVTYPLVLVAVSFLISKLMGTSTPVPAPDGMDQ